MCRKGQIARVTIRMLCESIVWLIAAYKERSVTYESNILPCIAMQLIFCSFFKIDLCMLRAPLAHFFLIVVDAQVALHFCLFIVIPVLQICNLCLCVFTCMFMRACVCVSWFRSTSISA